MADKYTAEDAKRIGDSMQIDWNKYKLEEFTMGLNVELEHGTKGVATNVTNDDEIMTAKIAMAHLDEIPDYYTRLAEMEKEGEDFWEGK